MRRIAELAAVLVLGLAAPAFADDAAQHGDAIFKRTCFICHATTPGMTKLGPSLAGVLGRKAGTLPGYTYSEAMKKAGLTWNESTLNTYLGDPRALVPGTKMTFVGLHEPADRQAVIQYLATLK